jgi:hypothetical protein
VCEKLIFWLYWLRYCLNNPLIYTDPSGEFIFTAFLGPVGAIIDAACWGAVINGGIYAASTAVTGQQWDWGQFGKSLAVGAISGAASGGAGLLTQGLQVYGAIPGAFIEGGIQGAAGGLAGGFGNVIMEDDWGAFGSGFAQGFATGLLWVESQEELKVIKTPKVLGRILGLGNCIKIKVLILLLLKVVYHYNLTQKNIVMLMLTLTLMQDMAIDLHQTL